MRPSAAQILNGIKWSFETHLAPKLDDKQSQSMARSIVALLDHLQVRVANEGRLLADDNTDKKRLFRQLLDLLQAEPAARDARFAAVLADLKEQAAKEYRAAGTYPTVESMTEENEELKRTLIRGIEVLRDHKNALGAQTHAAADEAIRAQLARQLDRKDTLVLPFGKGRVYRNPRRFALALARALLGTVSLDGRASPRLECAAK